MGKKWAFPIFCRLNPEKEYAFEELIKLLNRRVHRASLSQFLQKLTDLNIISKQNRKYKLTEKGIPIQTACLDVAKAVLCQKECTLMNKAR